MTPAVRQAHGGHPRMRARTRTLHGGLAVWLSALCAMGPAVLAACAASQPPRRPVSQAQPPRSERDRIGVDAVVAQCGGCRLAQRMVGKAGYVGRFAPEVSQRNGYVGFGAAVDDVQGIRLFEFGKTGRCQTHHDFAEGDNLFQGLNRWIAD